MARIQFADFWPQLMGLVPAYSRDGVNGTSILLEKNPTIFSEFKTKTLLAQLTRTFLMEPRMVQETVPVMGRGTRGNWCW